MVIPAFPQAGRGRGMAGGWVVYGWRRHDKGSGRLPHSGGKAALPSQPLGPPLFAMTAIYWI